MVFETHQKCYLCLTGIQTQNSSGRKKEMLPLRMEGDTIVSCVDT